MSHSLGPFRQHQEGNEDLPSQTAAAEEPNQMSKTTTDIIGELRQLSHDLICTSPQADAIKAKHPAILDEAARRLAQGEHDRNFLLSACRLWDQGFIEGEEWDATQFLKWVNQNRRSMREAIACVEQGSEQAQSQGV